MKKQLLFITCFCLVIAFSNVCFAESLGVMTKEQIIEKYFNGRTLDPIEGIWRYPIGLRCIVKTSALEERGNYPDVDYLLLGLNEKNNDVYVMRKLRKMSTPYHYEDYQGKVIMISPMTIALELNDDIYRFLVRTYPQYELKLVSN